MSRYFGLILLTASLLVGCSNSGRDDPKKTAPGESPEEAAHKALAGHLKTIGDLDSPEDKRFEAITAVGAKGADGKAAVPGLLEVLKNSKRLKLRIAAAQAVAKIGHDAKEAVPVLIQLLNPDNEEFALVRAAALALGGIGSDAKAALPTIQSDIDRAIKYRQIYGQVDLCQALGRIDPDSKAVDMLLVIIKHGYAIDAEVSKNLTFYEKEYFFHPGLTVYAIRALGAMGPAAKRAVPELIGRTRGNYANAGIHAARALGQIGPDAREAVPALKELLQRDDSSQEFRAALREALAKIER